MALIHHTIVTGQSLAGWDPAGNTAATGPQARPTEITRFGAGGAREPLQSGNATDPDYHANWPERSIADASAPAGYLFNINTHRQGSRTYAQLKKGSAVYREAITTLQSGRDYAVGQGDSVLVEALHVIHGEADAIAGTPQAEYAADLIEWLADYTADAKAVTGQTKNLIGICSQNTRSTSDSPSSARAMLDVSRSQPNWFLAGPKYQLPHVDSLHLTHEGFYYLGELHARVHRKVVIEGGTWKPLSPKAITLDTNKVLVKFNVPVLPLVLDSSGGAVNAGFAVQNSTITGVQVVAEDTVQITLANAPLAAPLVSYSDIKGNLRDSCTDVSALDGFPLYNWCVGFQDSVGYVEATTPTPQESPLEEWNGTMWVSRNLEQHMGGGTWQPVTFG